MHTPGQKYTMQEHKCECLVNTLHDADCFGLAVKNFQVELLSDVKQILLTLFWKAFACVAIAMPSRVQFPCNAHTDTLHSLNAK